MAKLNPSASCDAEDVREIIDTDLGDAEIHAFINAAYFMSRPCSGKLGDCGGNAMLAEIQKHLAAHFISMSREPQAEQESIAREASVKYRTKTGMGLQGTTYGQTALVLDCSGQLARLGKKRASLRVWEHEDLDYDYDD